MIESVSLISDMKQMKQAASVGLAEIEPGMRAVANPAAGPDSVDFSQVIRGALDRVSQSSAVADQMGRDFQLGKPGVELHDVMIESQKASLGFEMTMQMRNKFVGAYKDLMNMQI